MTRILGNILDEERKEKKRVYSRERARRKRQDPAYRQLELERNARWQRDNSEQYAEAKRIAGRKWYQNNKDLKLSENKRWKEEHPDLVNLYSRRRNLTNGSSIISRSDYPSREYALILRGDPCSYCGGTVTTIDHIIPRSSDGENHWENFTGACLSCNASKGTSPLLEFLCR